MIQETLNASTQETVEQMESAMAEIDRRYSQGYGHDHSTTIQILDADMSGQPCGPKAAFATRAKPNWRRPSNR
ncbi:MAG: hypothetical protein AAGF01_20740 [Cyanobacteria bacterium P01_G01_bin.38]